MNWIAIRPGTFDRIIMLNLELIASIEVDEEKLVLIYYSDDSDPRYVFDSSNPNVLRFLNWLKANGVKIQFTEEVKISENG